MQQRGEDGDFSTAIRTPGPELLRAAGSVVAEVLQYASTPRPRYGVITPVLICFDDSFVASNLKSRYLSDAYQYKAIIFVVKKSGIDD